MGIRANTEARFQRVVVEFATLHGWLLHHQYDARRLQPGVPDLMLVRGTRLVFTELKVGSNTTSAFQDLWLASHRAGHRSVPVAPARLARN